MMIWNFSLHLNGLEEFTDDLANTLDESFADSLLASSQGRAHLCVGREAPSLNDAIRSAISDARRHGLEVDHVEIEQQDLAESELALW